MRTSSPARLSDTALIRRLPRMVSRSNRVIAWILAHLAEFDARRLYLPLGYPSMLAYCVGELHYSEDEAFKRIQAARAAQQFPAVLAAVADGRLHLTAVVRLKPHLRRENAAELIAAAMHRTRAEVDHLLAERFPGTELMPWVQVVGAPTGEHAAQLVPEPVRVDSPRLKVTPIAPTRYALQATIGQGTWDKLQYAQALLGKRLPSGDVAAVFDLALDSLVAQLEKRKFAATSRMGGTRRAPANPRHIPAHVKCEVWKRDGGQCNFVGSGGHRCAARKFLDYDHVEPVARGGRSTVGNVRLRCRRHNQLEAERAFGERFMQVKRNAAHCARDRAAAGNPRGAASANGNPPAGACVGNTGAAAPQTTSTIDAPQAEVAGDQQDRDVMSCLTTLGIRATDAHRAVDSSRVGTGPYLRTS